MGSRQGFPAVAILLLLGPALSLAARTPDSAQTVLRGEPQAPVWPDSYSVEYTFSLPYTAKIQPHGIRYPVVFHRDGKAQRVRMETYNGTNVIISTKSVQYELLPRIDRQQCLVWAEPGLADAQALPDLAGWAYQGAEVLEDGAAVHAWHYLARHQAKSLAYRFYAHPDGAPRRLDMLGTDALSGSHFDRWVLDYASYVPGRPRAELFDQPRLCEGRAPVDGGGRGPRAGARPGSGSGALRMAGLLPRVAYRGHHAGYDAFLDSPHGRERAHGSLADYAARAEAFERNAARIAAHNARNASYTMAMNRFGDWHREEYLAALLPRHGRARPATRPADDNGLRPHEIPHRALTDPARLPAGVDWRGSGADAAWVKDQASCGSCWAFGAAGAMEAAWFVATGERVSLSEQAVIDCAWGAAPGHEESAAACDGGDAWAGVAYAVGAGGLPSSLEYQYKGQSGYCEANDTAAVARFAGFSRVPAYDDAALMEAVYSRGPLAVSLDASHDSFTFYSAGVYAEPDCFFKKDQLDHSMMLVGYGTSAEGDYWLIRNSWSDHWGDAGYVKVSRDRHGCGAPADAMYVVADADGLRP
ncbi:hypothetical protein ACKKBG_A06525 [Auxenochlorella protothecoides x Auxenochlorella symbiontica]